MNQIIYPEKIEKNLIIYKNILKNNKRNYIFLFIISLIMLFSFIFYYIFRYFIIFQKEKISNEILEIYDIQKLYSYNNYATLPNIISNSGDIANILGIIQIGKINLRYPILSKTTNEFLQIAPCKFYGPELNSYGNFCIAGHNYDTNELFSNLDLLEINDIITIYNLNRILYILQNL